MGQFCPVTEATSRFQTCQFALLPSPSTAFLTLLSQAPNVVNTHAGMLEVHFDDLQRFIAVSDGLPRFQEAAKLFKRRTKQNEEENHDYDY